MEILRKVITDKWFVVCTSQDKPFKKHATHGYLVMYRWRHVCYCVSLTGYLDGIRVN